MIYEGKQYKTYHQIIDHALSLKGEEQKAFVKAYNDSGPFARQNIGYFSGYYASDKMIEIQRVFETSHPFFGSSVPTPEEAFEMGKKLAEKKP